MTNPTKIVQLSVLTFAVAISQAFRTVPAITVSGIAEEMNAGPAALALFGGIFHLRLCVDANSGGVGTRHIRRPPHDGCVFGVRNFGGSNLCLGSQH